MSHSRPLRVLVLGASGMLGHRLFLTLQTQNKIDAWGTTRNPSALPSFMRRHSSKLITLSNAVNFSLLEETLRTVSADVVVNCVGIIKQSETIKDRSHTLEVNSILPHWMADNLPSQTRLIQLSTDCVFSGEQGNYKEEDPANPIDFYGETKLRGEITDRPNVLTLRTSIIGHELLHRRALLEWFLSSEGRVSGYRRAVFNGLTSNSLSETLSDLIIQRRDLSGLFHLGTSPIAKYDLLRLLADVYQKSIDIEPDEALSVDRSLNFDKFSRETGYQPKPWFQLVKQMRDARPQPKKGTQYE